GEITNIESSQGWVFHIKLPERLLKYIIFKGSVAVNGVSLTVADLSGASFSVSVVPHSLEHTTLKTLKRGDSVNVECDMLGKYVESMVRPEARTEQSTVTKEFLGKHGFF
ncbi:MAG: riboflavin synthase, partial [Nitrospinota bacterium]